VRVEAVKSATDSDRMARPIGFPLRHHRRGASWRLMQAASMSQTGTHNAHRRTCERVDNLVETDALGFQRSAAKWDGADIQRQLLLHTQAPPSTRQHPAPSSVTARFVASCKHLEKSPLSVSIVDSACNLKQPVKTCICIRYPFQKIYCTVSKTAKSWYSML
jgi:hypothetical protein